MNLQAFSRNDVATKVCDNFVKIVKWPEDALLDLAQSQHVEKAHDMIFLASLDAHALGARSLYKFSHSVTECLASSESCSLNHKLKRSVVFKM